MKGLILKWIRAKRNVSQFQICRLLGDLRVGENWKHLITFELSSLKKDMKDIQRFLCRLYSCASLFYINADFFIPVVKALELCCRKAQHKLNFKLNFILSESSDIVMSCFWQIHLSYEIHFNIANAIGRFLCCFIFQSSGRTGLGIVQF